MKRKSGGSVTGGTGDIKPQIMTLESGTAGAVDDYVVKANQLPVPRFGTMQSRATIFELLWVDWYLNVRNVADTADVEFAYLATNTDRADGDTSTTGTFEADLARSNVFAAALWAQSLSTNGGFNLEMPIHIDLTDNNGNGVLVATDKLFVVGGNISGTNAGNYIAKVAYRMVNVGISEYVGIVQSQQSTQ